MAYPNDQQGKAHPFFARFLSVSKEESSIKSPSPERETRTYKYPSDWEDY
ncbi:microviridin/marinostatin family tricyclic proteinase inhibitor [Microcystis aeruginosa]|nr:microviridin/marinostatin family tricyclic proteinase inhibitor [Microcystis aeruginosa]